MSDRPTIGVDLRALVPEPTGIGVATIALLAALVRRDTLGFIGLSHAEVAPERLRAAGIDCEVEPAPLGVLWQQLQLPRRLRRGGIDLLWSPLLTLPWRLPGPRHPTPGVVTIHDLTPLLFPKMHRARVRWSVRPFIGRTTRIAAAIAVVSEATKRDLVARFPRCEPKIAVVPNAVSELFRPGSPGEVAEIREGLGLPTGYLLHVGTLEPRKNLGRLIDAWLEARRRDSTLPPLVLAGGSGWHSHEVATRIANLEGKGLHYLGRVADDELPALYRGATGFVFPSLYEGFGLPPLEAMASGVPVAVSNRSSLPEVVGDCGILFDPEDVDSMVDALGHLASDSATMRENSARGLVRARSYTWDRAAREMETLFERSLSLQSTSGGSGDR